MKHNLLQLALFLTTLLCFKTTFGQERTEIHGTILDPQNKPAFACSVQLLQASDSLFVKGDVTDEKGYFSLSGLPAGKYAILFSRVDLGKKMIRDLTLEAGQVLDLGAIEMEEKAKDLKEVEIIAKKPVFQRVEDKMIFNVSEMASAVGSNAYEMLRKAPGVVVDRDSRIILKGKTGVRIQINGKPSPLSVSDLASYLQSIPAGDIEAIEIIENPSSRYDAAGKGGIINIRLKKDKNLGTNGSSNASLGLGRKYPKLEAGSRFNHRNKKTNFFAGYTNNTNKSWNYNNFFRTQNGIVYDQKSESTDEVQGQFYRAGFDWFPNRKHTIGVLYFGGYKETTSESESNTRLLEEGSGKWYQNLYGGNMGKSYRTIHNTNLNYTFKDTLGHQLNIDVDYDKYLNNLITFQPNRYTELNGNQIRSADFANHAPSDIDIKTAKADYEQKLGGGKFSAGVKVSLIRTDNNFEFFNIPGGVYELDPYRSNHFVYTENVNAAYINFARQINKKINFQAGLRAEQTNSEGDLTSAFPQNDQNVKRTYLNLFPSATINFEQSDKLSWSINYSRRIDRPSYQDLNPFEFKLDELTYQKGNAFLKPQYTHSFSLDNTLFQFLNQSVSYNYTSDFSGQITDTTEGTRAFLTQKNIASEQVLGYNVSCPLQFAKWWTGYTNMGVNNLRYHADFGAGKTIDISIYTFNVYLQQNFEIRKWISLELSGFYNSPSVWGGTFRNRRFWNVDGGFKMKFLNDKLLVTCTVTDIFWSQKWKGTNNFGGLSIVADGGWESRQLRIGANYKFGNLNVKGARSRKTGSDAEAGRVKK